MVLNYLRIYWIILGHASPEQVWIILVIVNEVSVPTKLLMEILNRLLLLCILHCQVIQVVRKLDESLTEILMCLQDSV